MFDLTNEQKAIIEYPGTCFVLALAGGAKTHTISMKIRHIKEKNPDSKILYITFTRKAKEHAEHILKDLKGITVTNYHQLGYKILSCHKKELRMSDIDIVGESYCASLLMNLFNVKSKQAREMFSNILKLKCNETSMSDMTIQEKHNYVNFHSQLRKSRKYIYADLVQETNRLFEENLFNQRAKYMFKYDYIFIDEMQDNYIGEYKMVDNLLSLNPNCILSGTYDIFQSIYGFSNAVPAHALAFTQKHGNVILRLSTNFRSQSRILDVGNIFLKNMSEFSELSSNLVPFKGEGEKIKKWEYSNPNEQYQAVSNEINRLVSNGFCSYKDIYVLFRINVCGVYYERNALMNRIPFKLARGSILDSTAVNCLMFMLRFAHKYTQNSFTKEELFDLITYLASEMASDIADETIKTLNNIESAWTLLQKIQNINEIEVTGVGPARKKSLKKFHTKLMEMVDVYVRYKEHQNIETLIREMGAFILEFKFAKKASAIMFESISEDLVIMNDLLSNLEGDILDRINQIMIDYRESDRESEDKVLGMTVHKAKGLENKVVFIIDFQTFPASFGDPAEEERVAYVAVTRPKDLLYITQSAPSIWDSLLNSHSSVEYKNNANRFY